jgi:chromosome segregation ATPase
MEMTPIQANLRALVRQKERELHEINETRFRALEEIQSEREASLVDLRDRYDKLKEDFAYNLRLLEERDIELARFDETMTKSKSEAVERDTAADAARAEITQLQRAAAKRDREIAQMQLERQRLESSVHMKETEASEIERALRDECDRLGAANREAQGERSQLLESHEDRVSVLVANLQTIEKQMTSEKARHTAEATRLMTALEGAHEARDALEDELEKAAAREREFQRLIDDVQRRLSDRDAELERVNAAHTDEMKVVKATHSEEKLFAKSTHAAEIERAAGEHAAGMDRASAEHTAKIDRAFAGKISCN